MSDEQKNMLFQDEDYLDTYNKIQNLVQMEILNLVKGRIESTQEGKELLQSQLKIIKRLKGKIIQETNREMEMFRKFREFSKQHPEVTYEEFIKANI
jgi:predicted methyltransferase